MPTLEDGEWEDEATDTLITDEANLGSNSPGPEEVESDSLLDLTEPQPETQVEMSESESEEEPLPEFDPRFKEDFEGLLYLGHLEHKFEWMGHEFLIRTLKTDQVLEIGQIHARYRESLSDVKAYQAGVVAACVISVDGKPLPSPISSDTSDTELVNRFEYVVRSWYPLTLDAVYQEYILLEQRVAQVAAAMGKASG